MASSAALSFKTLLLFFVYPPVAHDSQATDKLLQLLTGKDYFVLYGSVLVPSPGRQVGVRGDTGGSQSSNMSNKLDVLLRGACDREGLDHSR